MGESLIQGEIAAQLARNEKLIETIGRHGGDLDDVRTIDFFFYTSTREEGEALGRHLEMSGFAKTAVSHEPIDGTWSVHAERQASVTQVTEASFVEQVVRIAAKYLAEFDGWGTAI